MKFSNKIITVAILCSFSWFEIFAQEDVMLKQIKIDQKETTLGQMLQTIEKQLNIHFSFDPENILIDTKVRLSEKHNTLKSIIELMRNSYNLEFISHGNVIIIQRVKKKNKTTATLRGIIKDAESGELLPGAEIRLKKELNGTVSNQYGFYSLTLPQGQSRELQVRFLGYVPVEFRFDFDADSLINISLSPEALFLKDVTIIADSMTTGEISSGLGNYVVTAQKIKETMSFAGEPDALKTLQFLPGVQSGNEGTTNLSVRGGSFDQNLYLLDEAPVYNPSHALSFFSIFNPDALQSVTLYKSAIPVSYGGRLSSVVSVRMKEGNRVKRTYSGSIGTIASRLTAEGPFSKKSDKISYMVSGRYSYAGHVVNGIYLLGAYVFNDPTANISTTNNTIGFYDLNAKVNYRKDDRNHFYFSLYSGHDNFYFSNITSGYALSWGNKTGTFRWNHVHNSKLFSNTTALFSDYRYQYKLLNNTQYFLWKARFQEFDIKQDYDFYPTQNHHMTFGGGIQLHWIQPGEVRPRSETAVTKTYSLQNQKPLGSYLYLGNEQSLNSTIRVVYGLRYSNFIVPGPSTKYSFANGDDIPFDSVTISAGKIADIYHRFDPRVALVITRDKHVLTTSYDHTTQYFHLLANSSVGLPTDIWMPSGGSIIPQAANIFAVNYQYFPNKTIEASAGAFYKSTNHIIDFKDNANLFVNRYVESQILPGRGKSYGVELFLQKTAGKFRSSISYTLSKATNTIPGINNGNSFPSRYDKRHNLSATGKCTLSKRWEVSSNFVYTTGGAFTVPAGNFTFDGVAFNYYSDRNNFRLPEYHRLDISWRYNSRKNEHRQYKSFWSFDIYNLYGRKNPFTIYSQQQDAGFFFTNVRAIYLFRVVPSISYNFTF